MEADSPYLLRISEDTLVQVGAESIGEERQEGALHRASRKKRPHKVGICQGFVKEKGLARTSPGGARMFTGLVEGMGRISFVRRQGQGLDLSVEVRSLQGDLAIGDSVSLSGCCTTVTRLSGDRAEFHMTRETLERTWFDRAEAGTVVNLERCLTPTARLGGHIVQGHVDGMGEVLDLDSRADGTDLRIRVPAKLERYLVEKGSVAIDGVSLTVARIEDDKITIALIPHTMEVTTLGQLRPGSRVNLEVDILAKYVERLLGQGPGPAGS